jgi:uncharacterized protein YgbK (DUF1537 family)
MLYTFYGDDFTGSTDVLEQLGSNGIHAVLFIGPPTAEHLANFPHVEAIGIAGDSRSRSPEWMSANLPQIFETLRDFRAPINHYKVCSTFDSSPTIGSIGRAIEIGHQVFLSDFAPTFVPIVVGAPHLRRYVAFGNLFAGAPDGTIQRIDRHPMSRHPVTPMHEADLRLHLAEQTGTKIGLIDIAALKARVPHPSQLSRDGWDEQTLDARLDTLLSAGNEAVLFDTVDDDTLAAVGSLIWNRAHAQPLFCVGSSGLTAALAGVWIELDLLRKGISALPHHHSHVAPVKPLLVLSGSCSAVTERQLRYALANAYHGIPIDPAALLNPGDPAFTSALESATQSLAAGQDTILYTALGTPESAAHGDLLGIALGNLLRELLARTSASTPIQRVLICGGDTSSHAVQQLGIYALTWAANIQPGAPLCRATADSFLDGLELVLKGGQVGTEDFFDHVRGN